MIPITSMTKIWIRTLLLVLLGISCRFPHTQPPLPSAEVYDEIARIPTDFLTGRLFVLDPGHGGRYSGAVTAHNLRESDINLAVALHLQHMLTHVGAHVILTRYTDTDFLPPHAPKRLGTDLKARCTIANRHYADLFISLHHNASATRHKNYNATETFVKMTDNRQSLDAARPVHQRLTTILGTGGGTIIPGNFYVLRHSNNPALLGEAAYMSNKRMEKLLRDPDYLKLEAAAYFLGITDYIAKGIPVITHFSPHDTILTATHPVIHALVTDPYGIDPTSIELFINGELVEHTFTLATGDISYSPQAIMPNGHYTVSLNVSNINGNAARTAYTSFNVTRPATHLLLQNSPSHSAHIGIPTPIEMTLLDAEWTPVQDGTGINFTTDKGHLRSTRCLTQQGKVTTYCYTEKPETITITATCGTLAVAKNIIFTEPARATIAGFILDATTQKPLYKANIRTSQHLFTTKKDGYFTFPHDTTTTPLRISCNGYMPQSFSPPTAPHKVPEYKLTRMFNGVLYGRRIVLNPEFGGLENGAIGTGGTRAADVNLRVARYLKQYLIQAGAEVALTRSKDTQVSDLERVLVETEKPTNLFITIRHAAQTTKGSVLYTAHHYQSTNGKRAARSIAQELSQQTGQPNAGLRPDYGYAVMQTGCPAIIVNAGMISDAATERKLALPAENRRTAYGIFCGILRYYDTHKRYSGHIAGTVQTAQGAPLSGALVTLDDHTVLQTGFDGTYLFKMLKKGSHTAVITKGGQILEKQTIIIK